MYQISGRENTNAKGKKCSIPNKFFHFLHKLKSTCISGGMLMAPLNWQHSPGRFAVCIWITRMTTAAAWRGAAPINHVLFLKGKQILAKNGCMNFFSLLLFLRTAPADGRYSTPRKISLQNRRSVWWVFPRSRIIIRSPELSRSVPVLLMTVASTDRSSDQSRA